MVYELLLFQLCAALYLSATFNVRAQQQIDNRQRRWGPDKFFKPAMNKKFVGKNLVKPPVKPRVDPARPFEGFHENGRFVIRAADVNNILKPAKAQGPGEGNLGPRKPVPLNQDRKPALQKPELKVPNPQPARKQAVGNVWQFDLKPVDRKPPVVLNRRDFEQKPPIVNPAAPEPRVLKPQAFAPKPAENQHRPQNRQQDAWPKLVAAPKPAAAPKLEQNSVFRLSVDGCYRAESSEAIVSFCVNDIFAHGKSAGGVFQGTLTCESDDAELCEEVYGLRPYGTKRVVVKFNKVGSERRRGHYPSSSTEDEVTALTDARGHENAIRLYKTFGEKGTRIRIGSKDFWNPGMVIERAEGGELAEFEKQKARLGKSLDIVKFVAQINCMFEQLEDFSDFMISKSFFHTDMHYENILLSKKTVRDSKGVTCPLIKVIDFGVIAKLPTVGDKVVGIFHYADIVDFNIRLLLRHFPPEKHSELRKRLAPQERTRQFFLKYLRAAGRYVVQHIFPRLAIAGAEDARQPDSYTRFLFTTITDFLR